MVLPLAREFEADVYLPNGEISDTMLHQMAKTGAEDERPMVVFVIADFDPGGHQMAISIGRKLQAMRDLLYPKLDFQLFPIALTEDQVREFNLPSTPLKETERRSEDWRAEFDLEQTEIDALAQLRPRILEQIVRDAIAPFFDETLYRRLGEAEREWRREANRRLAEQIDQDALQDLKDEAEAEMQQVADDIAAFNDQVDQMVTISGYRLPPMEIPRPDMSKKVYGKPLISSAWSWTKGSRSLIARKTYGNQAKNGADKG